MTAAERSDAPGDAGRWWAYDRWANLEVLRALELRGRIAAAERLLAHVLAASRVWLDRVHGRPPGVPVWPDHLPADCPAEIDALHDAWLLVAASDQTRIVTYRNSRGEVFETAAGDIATHVLLHSAYHRGQIAAEIRRAGIAPPLTDYIHYVRSAKLR